MCLFLFALLFRFDKKLFYPFVLRTISTFNRYAYCVVARSVVNNNTQQLLDCLFSWYDVITSKSKQIIGCALSDVFSKNFLIFLIFLNMQIDMIILETDVEQFTLTTKKIIAYHL